MATFKVGNITFNPLSSAPNATGYNTGRYWVADVNVMAQKFDRRRIDLPGVDGYKVKLYGSRGTPILGHIAYIQTTHAACFTALEADRSSLVNTLFTVIAPSGITLNNCELIEFSEGAVLHTGDSKFYMQTSINLFSLD